MKNIIYISGNRADFSLMIKPLLEINKYFNLTIIVTGMHLSRKWGYTIKEIENYQFKIKCINIHIKYNNLISMLYDLGKYISKFTKVIAKLKPDLILVEGDRGESLAGAIVGAHLNIPVVHHGGGDISDSIDNKIRNAISTFSDYHLTGNMESYNNLLRMGFSQSKIINVGEPGLDDIVAGNFKKNPEIIKKYNLNPDQPILLLIFHPNTKEYTSIKNQITEILEAIKELKITTLGLYANADAGGIIINEILNKYQSILPFLKIYKHFYREDFLGLMSICSAMVGNSSSGITELPLFKKPFVCVGTRQKGRLKAKNVIDVNYEKSEIINAIKKALYDKDFKIILDNLENPYGDGTAYLKITDVILKILNK